MIIIISVVVLISIFLGIFLTRQLIYPLPYRNVITTFAQEQGLDSLLVAAVIREESRFRPHVVSDKGARGLMQLMPSTADWIAKREGLNETESMNLFDPETNIQLGSLYLSYLLDYFDDNIAMSVAAYNGGLSRVQSWKDSGIWTGSVAEIDNIPTRETRVFVRRVLRSYRFYRLLYNL